MPATTRPWGGPEPPGVAYVYEPDRKHERPAAHLAGFAGCLQVDGATKRLQALAEGNAVTLAFCWAHARRKLLRHPGREPGPDRRRGAGEESAASTSSNAISGGSELRRGWPPAKSAPRAILEAMKPWLEAKLAAVSGKSKLAEAIRYALSRWAGLTRYLDDGRIEIDNNVVERAMRPIALGRKESSVRRFG